MTFARLYTVAGRNKIVYEGRTWTKFQYKIDPSVVDPNIEGAIICKSKWSITLTMTETLDGGMQFVVDYERPSPDISRWKETEIYDTDIDWLKQIYSTAASNFDYFINSVSDSLQGSEKFTLPVSITSSSWDCLANNTLLGFGSILLQEPDHRFSWQSRVRARIQWVSYREPSCILQIHSPMLTSILIAIPSWTVQSTRMVPSVS
jgi:hypothetical protein